MAKKSKQTSKVKETEVASRVVEWLEYNGWEVYKEVSLTGSGAAQRIDILAVKDGLYWGIECKSNFNFQVICQANNWQDNLHMVSVAVPTFRIQKKDDSDLRLAASICKDFLNIGLIQVDTRYNRDNYRRWYRESPGEDDDKIYFKEVIKVSHNPEPKEPKYKLPILYEEQKDSEAGNNKGEFFTIFKGTIKRINDFLIDKDEYDFKLLLETVGHHYSNINSAKGQLAKFINEKFTPGFELERRGNKNWIVRINKLSL